VIWDLMFTIVLSPIRWLLDGIPTFSWPDWFDANKSTVYGGDPETMGGYAFVVGRFLINLDGWVPVPLLFQGLTALMAAWVFHFTVKVGRLLVSHVTGGGGAT
jgi:hypothetical protein